jgi:hypothetical protein
MSRFLHRAFPLSMFGGLLSLAIILCLSQTGCRKKSVEPPPDTNTTPGQWSMYLHGPSILYRDQPNGHVPNFDSIIVRVWNDQGVLQNNIWVKLKCDVDTISATNSTHTISDTASNWRGCFPHIMYWGTGGVDGAELIHAFAVVNSETVATASYGFKVRNPPAQPE